MFSLGTPELLVTLGVALLLFGSRLPEVAKSLGRGVFEFKKGLAGMDDELQKIDEESGHKPPPQ